MAEFPKLHEAITSLREELRAYPIEVPHYISDTALFGLAVDVVEHAIAVQVLKDSEVPRAAFANARAAFEAGQDIFLLTSESEEYDRLGCLARVHELHENFRLQGRYNRANEEAGLSLQERQEVQDVVRQDADAWNDLAPGTGSILMNACDEFLKRPASQRKHWTGLTREAIGFAVAEKLGGESGVGRMYDAMYGSLSTHSHPRMRVDQRMLEEVTDGMFHLGGKPSDKEIPAAAAAYACIQATVSLKRRREFFRLAA